MDLIPVRRVASFRRSQPSSLRLRSLLLAGLILSTLGYITSPTTALSPEPSQVGQWSAPFSTPVVAIHMMLLDTGEVLMWDKKNVALWNPTTGTFTSVTPNRSLFCAAQTTLADGRALAIGGQSGGAFNGVPDADVFDPTTQSWTEATSMDSPRWYPTATALQDGRVLVVSGSTTCNPRNPPQTNPYVPDPSCIANIPEIYDPATNTWTSLTNASHTIALYPFMFPLPDGGVLHAGSTENNTITQTLDIATQTWTTVDGIVPGGSAAMFRPGQIIKAGSPAHPGLTPTTPAVNTA